jgi:uncharacterized protein involved in exopolysaccharide biosynthesis
MVTTAMKPKLLLCLALVLSGVGLWILLRPMEYQATVRIQVEPDANASGQDESYDPYFIQTEFEIIQSQIVLGRVVEALNLNVEWGKKYAAGETLNTLETIKLLQRRLNFHLINNTKLIEIAVTDENPVEAAKIANAIAQAYRNYTFELRWKSVNGGIKLMQDEYQKETADIANKQERLGQLRKQLNLTNPEPAASTLASNYPSYFQATQDLSHEEAIHKQRQANIDSEKSSVQNEKTPVEIVNPAVPPASPIGPSRLLGMVLLLGGLVAFVSGFYLISTAKKP